jgi:hypothetical protein
MPPNAAAAIRLDLSPPIPAAAPTLRQREQARGERSSPFVLSDPRGEALTVRTGVWVWHRTTRARREVGTTMQRRTGRPYLDNSGSEPLAGDAFSAWFERDRTIEP